MGTLNVCLRLMLFEHRWTIVLSNVLLLKMTSEDEETMSTRDKACAPFHTVSIAWSSTYGGSAGTNFLV